MGGTLSNIYGQSKRLLRRYNAGNRALKFLDKGNLPAAPRHPLPKPIERKLSREALEDIHCKDPQLNEFLKKVYLTSTSQITGTPSKRPKPKKENEGLRRHMFYEPDKPTPGFCTISNIIKILHDNHNDPFNCSPNVLAVKYNLDKGDVDMLLAHYSLFIINRLQMFNAKEVEQSEEDESETKIQLEVNTQLEKKPMRVLDSK